MLSGGERQRVAIARELIRYRTVQLSLVISNK